MTTPMTPVVSRSAAELRRAFLDFFVARGHTLVPSAPLVPNDPTLLFTTAGMVQFKPYYTAQGDVPYKGRAVSVQKCLRLTDLENVGRTPRHDTFFEMLGNFSFGDPTKGAYFKEEAIVFAWEFVTAELKLPVGRLYASIFEGEGKLPRDDEAAALWKKVGMKPDHIVALGRADNFWGPAGGQGPCGPCSEIYFDLGEQRPGYLEAGAFWGEKPGDPGDRYMEFWNLVFPQFDAAPDGTLTPLARPGIDTGMGLERLAMLMQGKSSIFDADVFTPLVERVLARAGRSAAQALGPVARDARIIADHVRALTFAIAEGALPGNEGAGYVLRRLLRRAVTRGRAGSGLAMSEPFMASCAERAVEIFGEHYRELTQHAKEILGVLEREETKFAETFEAGLARLEELLGSSKRLTGDDAFMLHDTYGFPIELTEEIAAERGVQVDREGFDRAMKTQRDRARTASKFAQRAGSEAGAWTEATSGADSRFLGYETLAASGVSLRRWREAEEGVDAVLDQTPFYAESGGQVADRGQIAGDGVTALVTHVFREGESIVHRVRLAGDRARWLEAGAGGRLEARVDAGHRLATQRHHTATHMLHASLRQTLGTHVRQAGSLVAPDRLRFDYTHFEAPSGEQLAEIERRVAEWALRNTPVSWEVMPLEKAKGLGAMALFGEKYGADVRVVTVAGVEEIGVPVSRELCGGTHVARTGDIGPFLLVSDSAIASGVRRIEALCGHEALGWLKSHAETLARAAAAFQVKPEAVPQQIEKLKADIDRLKKAQAEADKGGLEAEMARVAAGATVSPGGRWAVARLESEADINAARDAADKLRGSLQRGAAVLAIAAGGKITLLAAVTDDLVAEKKLNASDLVKKVAQVAGGSGGGKPHLALAGAKDASKVDEALAEAKRLLAEALG